ALGRAGGGASAAPPGLAPEPALSLGPAMVEVQPGHGHLRAGACTTLAQAAGLESLACVLPHVPRQGDASPPRLAGCPRLDRPGRREGGRTRRRRAPGEVA